MRLRSEAISAHLRSSIRTIAEFHANLCCPQTRCRRTLAPTLVYCNTVTILTPAYVPLEYLHVLRLAREIADFGIVAALRDVVVHLPNIFLSTEFARNLCGEVVSLREEDFRAEGLQQSSPRLTGQHGP